MHRQTPEFVRWAIARACHLREFDAWEEPEQVERRLRPLRVYAEAINEGRLFEGICVRGGSCQLLLNESGSTKNAITETTEAGSFRHEAKGFRAAEVLDGYGGHDYVSELCGNCPANAERGRQIEPLAGCWGLFEFSGLENFHQDLETVVLDLGLTAALAAVFPPTTPRWYGLWIDHTPAREKLDLLSRLFTGLVRLDDNYRQRLGAFLAALEICLDSGLALHLALVPRGAYSATKWMIFSHCWRCKAHWPAGSRHCGTCGQAGHPEPSRKRCVRGDRPYWRLAGFLGAANVGPFLERYLAFRNSSRSANANSPLALG